MLESAEARIAVAANFRNTALVIAEALSTRLATSLRDHRRLDRKAGESNSQWAPYDIFMAADRDRPQQLVDRGVAVAGSQQIYAVGELGLWWPGVSGTPALGALANLEPRSVLHR
ncbi:MAG: hypothetical protein CM15mP74_18500 [Halieaceae bacterium]|nr:MAG: hypothetical protein CM15mP74_18500 [Halieaceae bacterium]